MSAHSSTRRGLLQSAACGFGSLALAGLCDQEATATQASPLAAREPHHAPRAKRVIFLFMQGGPSQVDTFDPKAMLDKKHGEKVEFHNARQRKVRPETVMRSPWSFRRYGESGRWVSELLPHAARHVDDLCVIRGMHTEGVAHGPATLFLHTGATNRVRPSMGAWISYGLGTENQNLPSFVTINPPPTKGGPRNYANAFLPTIHQGTPIGRAGVPLSEAGVRHLTNPRYSRSRQREQFELLQAINREQLQRHGGDEELEATVASFELAYRMQQHAPEVLELAGETESTLTMYGIGKQPTDSFGRQCLMARRLAERGVRFIQVSYADTKATPRWDQHSRIQQHEKHALATDQPVAALLADLKQRGLLEDTLVWWGGEFGRTPYSQGNDGRDHNPSGFSIWLAGGGVKPGFAWGQTDEFGYSAVENKVHMHDLHATVLHLLGLDHKQLTYRYAGRDFRLTDVHGRVVKEIMA